MLTTFLMMCVGLPVLIFGADWFVRGASAMADSLGVSPFVIGLIVVGFATSAPEIMVGCIAALQGKTAIAMGNAVGSNIANIGLVLGVTLLFMPISIASVTLKRGFICMFAAIFIALSLMLDKVYSRLDGAILFACFIGFLYLTLHTLPKSAKDEFAIVEESSPAVRHSWFKIFALLIFGLSGLLGGAELLVRNATIIAQHYGVSDLVIGLTIIAIGTSLPELAASIMSVIKKESALAVGNIIGSNTFNMLAVLGLPGVISPALVPEFLLLRDFPVMIVMTIFFGIAVFVLSRDYISRLEGVIFLAGFLGYQYSLFFMFTN